MQLDVRLAVTDSPVGELPVKVRCKNPGHVDSSASCAVYMDGLFCFGCGVKKHGADAVDWLLGHAVEDYEKFTTTAFRNHMKREKTRNEADPLHPAIADAFHTFLMSGRRDYRKAWLYERGLNDISLMEFRIGHDGSRFSIPIYGKARDLVTIRYRRDDYFGKYDYYENEIPKYCGTPGRNGTHLYPEWLLADRTNGLRDYAVIVEGELDAIRLVQEGLPAITVTNGAGHLENLPALLLPYNHIKKLYIASDRDEPGIQAAFKTRRAADALGFYTEFVCWDERYKDVTEFYKAGGRLEYDGEDMKVIEGETK